MKMKIRSIHGHGKADEEYVVLDVIEDCNAHYYMLSDTTYTAKRKISNKTRHNFWFSPKKLKAGDVVYLYTKVGKYSSSERTNETISHKFYWGLKVPIWNDDGDGAILFEIETWKTTKVSETK